MKTSKNTHVATARAITRRHALMQTAALGIGLAAAGGAASSRNAAAADLPPLGEDTPQAKALGYRHDAASVDLERFPMADPAAKNCANCQLFQANAGADWSGCPLFAGKGVNAAGWCTAWVKRVG